MNKKRAVKNFFGKAISLTFKSVIALVILSSCLFLLNSCVAYQNMPEPFDGKHIERTNPILDPLTDKGEQLGNWVNEKVDPEFESGN